VRGYAAAVERYGHRGCEGGHGCCSRWLTALEFDDAKVFTCLSKSIRKSRLDVDARSKQTLPGTAAGLRRTSHPGVC